MSVIKLKTEMCIRDRYCVQVTLFYHILLILLLAKVLLQKNSVFDWIFLAGLFYLCYKSYQYNYDFYNIFGTMMFLCCAKNIEIKKIVKLDLYIRIVRSVLFLTLDVYKRQYLWYERGQTVFALLPVNTGTFCY